MNINKIMKTYLKIWKKNCNYDDICFKENYVEILG